MDTKSDSEDSSDEENEEAVEGDEVCVGPSKKRCRLHVAASLTYLFRSQGITVDFEGRNPIDPDLDGIKQMLGQLFVKAHIDLSELASVIIGECGRRKSVSKLPRNNRGIFYIRTKLCR